LSAAAVLGRVPLFAGLSADELAGLATGLRARQYARGEVVFLAGDPGSSLCIVESGRVRLGFSSPDGRERSLALLGPGDFFGELALLDGRPRSADAVATEPSRLLLLPRESFLQSLRSHPELAITLLGVLSERLRRDAQLLQDAAFLDVPGRLAGTLFGRRARDPGRRNPRERQPLADGVRAERPDPPSSRSDRAAPAG
jgi:CRP-like cAMP-binding protein